MSRQERKAYWSVIKKLSLVLLVLGAFAVWATMAWASQLVAFTPYEVEDYRIRPEIVCPGDPVETLVTRSIAEDHGVHEADVLISWRQVKPNGEVGEIGYDLQEYTTPMTADPEMRTVLSPVVKTAPTEPGEWRIRSRTEVYGTVFGGLFGTSQVVRLTSGNAVEVLPEDHPDCVPVAEEE